MREIDRYNEIDCRVMAEVLDYLRREHELALASTGMSPGAAGLKDFAP